MNRFSSIFGQILHLFSKREFFETVHATQAECGAKGFNCRDQFVAMLFCQLGQAHSLQGDTKPDMSRIRDTGYNHLDI